jgi:ribosomal protein S12 methylthiotransferase
MVDGPSPDSPLVWQGRLEGQAPDIDAVVYLDRCDPEGLRPGSLIQARIEGARGYDVVAAPVG